MPVVALKTEPRCKLCSHPRRAEIDALLERRSKRERDDAGSQVNEAYVLERLAEWDVPNPTAENIKVHWRRHCELVSEETLEQGRQIVSAALGERADGTITHEDLDEGLRFLWTVYIREQRERADRGEDLRMTHDQALKVAAEMTRRRDSQAQNELLRALGGGIGRALGGALVATVAGSAIESEPSVELEAEEAEFEALPAPGAA